MPNSQDANNEYFAYLDNIPPYNQNDLDLIAQYQSDINYSLPVDMVINEPTPMAEAVKTEPVKMENESTSNNIDDDILNAINDLDVKSTENTVDSTVNNTQSTPKKSEPVQTEPAVPTQEPTVKPDAQTSNTPTSNESVKNTINQTLTEQEEALKIMKQAVAVGNHYDIDSSIGTVMNDLKNKGELQHQNLSANDVKMHTKQHIVDLMANTNLSDTQKADLTYFLTERPFRDTMAEQLSVHYEQAFMRGDVDNYFAYKNKLANNLGVNAQDLTVQNIKPYGSVVESELNALRNGNNTGNVAVIASVDRDFRNTLLDTLKSEATKQNHSDPKAYIQSQLNEINKFAPNGFHLDVEMKTNAKGKEYLSINSSADKGFGSLTPDELKAMKKDISQVTNDYLRQELQQPNSQNQKIIADNPQVQRYLSNQPVASANMQNNQNPQNANSAQNNMQPQNNQNNQNNNNMSAAFAIAAVFDGIANLTSRVLSKMGQLLGSATSKAKEGISNAAEQIQERGLAGYAANKMSNAVAHGKTAAGAAVNMAKGAAAGVKEHYTDIADPKAWRTAMDKATELKNQPLSETAKQMRDAAKNRWAEMKSETRERFYDNALKGRADETRSLSTIANQQFKHDNEVMRNGVKTTPQYNMNETLANMARNKDVTVRDAAATIQTIANMPTASIKEREEVQKKIQQTNHAILSNIARQDVNFDAKGALTNTAPNNYGNIMDKIGNVVKMNEATAAVKAKSDVNDAKWYYAQSKQATLDAIDNMKLSRTERLNETDKAIEQAFKERVKMLVLTNDYNMINRQGMSGKEYPKDYAYKGDFKANAMTLDSQVQSANKASEKLKNLDFSQASQSGLQYFKALEALDNRTEKALRANNFDTLESNWARTKQKSANDNNSFIKNAFSGISENGQDKALKGASLDKLFTSLASKLGLSNDEPKQKQSAALKM